METKRPGQASVQYGDLRGEAAADMADDVSSLNSAARSLGFEVAGTVLGIRMYGSPILDDKVNVTVQVFQGGGSWEQIKTAADAGGGTIRVTEHAMEVPLAAFMRCFKRLNVSLFMNRTDIRQIEIADG